MKMIKKLITTLTLIATIIIGPGSITSFGESEEITMRDIYDESVSYETAVNDIKGGYYYNQLNDIEKKTYDKLVEGANNFEEQIDIRGISLEGYYKVQAAFSYDNPQYFWMHGYTLSVTENTHEPIYAKYKVEPDTKEKFNRVNQITDDIIKSIPEGYDEYEKTKYLYEWVVRNTEYDLEAPENQEVTSVFINKVSVCAGYSRAFQMLCNKAGLDCTYVTGSTDGIGHAWNLMYLEGNYFWTDATWGEISRKNDRKIGEDIRYDYFLTKDDTMNNTHVLSKDIITKNNHFKNVFSYPD
ncbi:transglutaminase domain-containing protein [Thomasclavelia cocleata]|uniref:transglutaminase domain-containing protein n=1 Tax=Thomasclavelia cocleata TaxID=69824 RepID=UPI00256EF186|nr:transglutaminase domain-containing protein [Thomasclavelia cocleata]